MNRLAEITTLCEAFHCLPSELFEEDGYLIEGMKAVLIARAEKQQIEIDKMKKERH